VTLLWHRRKPTADHAPIALHRSPMGWQRNPRFVEKSLRMVIIV